MKVPIDSTQTHQSQSGSNTVKPNLNTANLCNYEPKSVLDLWRSSSPCTTGAKPAPKTEISQFLDPLFDSGDNQIHLEEPILDNFEDWDSLIQDLGLHEDSSVPQSEPHISLLPGFIPNLNYNQIQSPYDPDFHRMNDEDRFNFVDELIRAADCVESGECQLARAILARLNHQLRAPLGKPLQRAAFYFKEVLQGLLTGSTHLALSSDIVQTIKAYKIFSNVSPIIMFSNFTANEAILDAVDGSLFIHVIDFDIGFGGQWASFMREVSERAHFRKTNSPVLRISAVVSEDYTVESRLVRDNLNQFALELQLACEIEFVSVQTFEYLSFKAINFMEGEKTVVLLSPAIFTTLGVGILNDLRQLSPHLTVMVDSEGVTGCGSVSFRRSLIDGLEFYSTVIESLEAAGTGGGDDWIRRIETYMLRPKILAMVEATARRAPPWREAFAITGMRPVVLSQFAEFQAECLLRKVQVRGFHVAKQQAELVLCWQERPMVATSAWKC